MQRRKDLRYVEWVRTSIRYLSENGWHILAGTDDNKYCCAPEDIDFKNPMTIESALKIQIKD